MSKAQQYLLLGTITGLISAALGIGGGGVMIPIMTVFLGYTMKEAVPLSLVVIIPIATVGGLVHTLSMPQSAQWIAVFLIAAGSIGGTAIGAYLHQHMSNRYLSLLFSSLLLFSALKLLGVFDLSNGEMIQFPQWTMIIIGIFAGISSALFGIGGGLINVPAFTILYGFSMHSAITSSMLAMIITTFSSIFMHRKLSQLQTDKLQYLIGAAFVSASAGAFLSKQINPSTLKMLFGIFLLYTTFRFLKGVLKKD
ncbi:MAG TPA: sulfite exporter TauE/SafE family protein [Candidatus Marinimicrobia bacterium]|nr:sulfite exporter TauE/SafE family protein [Candidatus Neomarinimicrobiota bacterium]